jgi:hypothetical protein
VVGCFENGNESSDSIKEREFIEQLICCRLLNKGSFFIGLTCNTFVMQTDNFSCFFPSLSVSL